MESKHAKISLKKYINITILGGRGGRGGINERKLIKKHTK